ncbi:uncharacterized protein [Macrobrachium rosenbergii]|uniref:uncharacterized protein isoform X2 n=1 Tax=Macrobrachium rosenbergii TaxID=79674 RepID=UPI0034D569C6
MSLSFCFLLLTALILVSFSGCVFFFLKSSARGDKEGRTSTDYTGLPQLIKEDMATSGSVLSSEDSIALRLSLFVRKYGKKVVHFIYSFHFLQGHNKTIKETLTDNQVPLKGKKSPFNGQELKNLTEKPPEDLDITLMNKICQVLWQKGVNDPGDVLKKLLKIIKDERNFVSHEEPHMSETDLEGKLKYFQATLEETLEEINSLFPSNSGDTDQLKAEIQHAVPELQKKIREKYDPSDPRDVQRLQEVIEEFGSELSDMIKESAEAELLSLNERLCQILPYDWLVQYGTTVPGNIMVSLQVADDEELNRGPHGNQSITVTQQEILNKDKIGKDFEVVIISGDAGSGKTTILCSYAEGWCKKTTDIPELSSFPLLLNMQFRNHDHDNFDDYLKSLIPKTVARFPFDLVKSVVLGSQCLVLCDGYDEANEKSKKLFSEMLSLASNKMKFVVTTRPGNTEGLTKIVNKAKRSRINLKISGLQEEDMKLLAEKLIGHLVKDDDVTQQEQLKKELLQKTEEMDTGTGAILQTPLYFNLFILLYIECPELRDEMSTRTSVYLQLRKHKIKRISDKTEISEESLEEEFDALYRKWSLKHYMEEKYEWSEADVRSFKREINSPEVLQNFAAIMSSYFSIKKTKKQLEIVNVYCHRHRSEQEFAAAGSICDDVITSGGRRLQGGGKILGNVLKSRGLWEGRDLEQLFGKFGAVISFIPGILYGTQRDVLYDTIEEIHELYVSYNRSLHDALLEPSIETRVDKKIVESLVSQMERETSLKNSVRFMQPKSLYVLPSLLPKLKPKEIKLDFTFLEVQAKDISPLSETSKAAYEANARMNNHIRINLRELILLAGGVALAPVDYLQLIIVDDGRYEDLESLRPLSPLISSAKELTLTYHMGEAPEDRIAQVINRTLVPTSRQEGAGTTDLEIIYWGDRDLKLLLQSLTLPPLRKIDIWPSPPPETTDDIEDLKTLCRQKGIPVLRVGSYTFNVMENPDSEGEEMDEDEEKKRKREEGEEEEEREKKRRMREEEGEEGGSTSREREVTQ